MGTDRMLGQYSSRPSSARACKQFALANRQDEESEHRMLKYWNKSLPYTDADLE